MARTQKDIVDYFPHYAISGKTLFILESKYKNDGYAFWFKLLERLCQTPGHFIDCNNDAEWQFLIAKTGVSEITGSEMISLLVNLGQIDSEMWKNKIIWCENLVNNIRDVYTKRGRKPPEKPQKINNCYQESSCDVISEPEIELSDDFRRKSTQIKLNEIKIKKRKERKKKSISKKQYLEFVFLTNEEYEKLIENFGEKKTNELIENLNLGIGSKGYKYTSHYHTILNWNRREEEKKKNNPKKHLTNKEFVDGCLKIYNEKHKDD